MKYLNAIPNSWWRDLTVDRYGRKGTPDIIGCYKGKFYALELKQGDNEAEPLQEYNLKEITKSGGVAMEVYNLNELRSLLP